MMHDVIVVGARCAGSPIAMLLAKRGYQVLLLDRAIFPSDMVMSTHFIHQRGIACLDRWGLRDQLVATGTPPVQQMMIRIGEVTLVGSPPAVDGETSAFAPRRVLLDDILVRAAENSGADLREGCRIQRLIFDDGRVVGVQGVTQAGSSFVEKARMVIGADGPASRVAKEVGAEKYARKPALEATAWIYWEKLPQAGLELHLADYESIYCFPTSNGSTLVGANWAMDRFQTVRHDLAHHYFELLGRAAPELAARVANAKRADDKLHVGSTPNFFRNACGPGWVLLGDAHYKKDPCTAQGISDTFCDAEYLAEAIDRGFCGDQDLLRSLQDYEKDRVGWIMPFYELTCQMATLAPPEPDVLSIYQILQSTQDDTNAFLGTITGAVSPSSFFAPENIGRILNGARE